MLCSTSQSKLILSRKFATVVGIGPYNNSNNNDSEEKDISQEDDDGSNNKNNELIQIKKEMDCIESCLSQWDIENEHMPNWWWFFQQQQSSSLSKESMDSIIYEKNLLRLQGKVNDALCWDKILECIYACNSTF